MNKRLLITSTDLMMVQFLVPHVINLSNQGFDIDLACSEVGNRFHEIEEKLAPYVNKIYKISLRRSPVSIKNFKGYSEMLKVISSGKYDYIWTNEPVMGVVTLLAARQARRRHNTKMMYMAHGFHFYTGAPALNWMIFYPIEKFMARITDLLVTVNHEDFERTKSFRTKKIAYIHGIGINTGRLSRLNNGSDIRKELGLDPHSFLVLSVGELNKNKNQKTIIDAIHIIPNNNVHYLICGKGDEELNLKNQVSQYGLENRIHFLGYRFDVMDICSQSDIYIMPSHREGLPVSSLEAMYCGLPLITSDIRGLVDVNKHGVNGFLCRPNDASAFAKYILCLYNDMSMRKNMGKRNKTDVIPYTVDCTKVEIENLLATL